MNKKLKDAGINETVFTIRGNPKKLKALPENLQKEYETYIKTRSSRMAFKSKSDQEYL